nr:3-methyladenine DNA glycosylase [Dactylosporangium sucinum]
MSSTADLARATWAARRVAHEARVDAWIEPHLARRRRGEKHPVEDFLFTYYSYRPAQLRRWFPGTPDPAELSRRRPAVEWIRDLLAATASRPPHLGCFGLHEWAMVYRQTQEQVRHNAWPLRLGAAGTDAVVAGSRIRCSHFDAFRFYTEPARPLNLLQPTREAQHALEQPGCLHANMDLYKHAYKLAPLVPAELIADCFELARDIRTLDMRASPYDLAALGYEPVRIETPEGRVRYVEAQRAFAERAAPLRARLLAECERLLASP